MRLYGLLGFMLSALMPVVLGACNGESCNKPTCGDAKVSPADGPGHCQTEKTKCAAGEINAFGVCLAQSGMVKVSAGQFTMGKTETGKDYSPEHKVTLKEYLIDKTEVTMAQYQACVDCGACVKPLRDGSHSGRQPYFRNTKYKDYPVIYVTYKDAKTYCEGIGKRLPTEAEWEKAARGSSTAPYPWGDAPPTKDRANFSALVNDTTPVTNYGDKGKSPVGALNMAGNVWEWVSDAYAATYYAKSPASDPKGPAPSNVRVVRGGCFISKYEQIKTTARGHYVETAAMSTVGFRCAKDKW